MFEAQRDRLAAMQKQCRRIQSSLKGRDRKTVDSLKTCNRIVLDAYLMDLQTILDRIELLSNEV